ncbi:hypothetical protein H6F89_05600 [Cyanobacteria bacterium FACHB-63]|nr:hypothetical protein [Cyanobacteria bacterium FACHB-DQ100]MBD1842892.1 hypothetical protein [Cyanobacteria bacterium FACHB-63]MBD2081422.1 hypothetical protein [Leptolyngbya sp. FACHB-17]
MLREFVLYDRQNQSLSLHFRDCLNTTRLIL